MRPRKALGLALDEHVGPGARAHGFDALTRRIGVAERTWVRRNALGDIAVVAVSGREGPSEDDFRAFEVEIAVTPEPRLAALGPLFGEHFVRTLQNPAHAVSGPLASPSIGAYYATVAPPAGAPTGGSGSLWSVDDADTAPTVAAGIAAELDRSGWPTLTRLLDRDAFLAQVRTGDLGNKGVSGPRLLAILEAELLADQGPSPRLDELIALLDEGVDRQGVPHAGIATAFIRERAAARRPSLAHRLAARLTSRRPPG